jgi:hypothetical protein
MKKPSENSDNAGKFQNGESTFLENVPNLSTFETTSKAEPLPATQKRKYTRREGSITRANLGSIRVGLRIAKVKFLA